MSKVGKYCTNICLFVNTLALCAATENDPEPHLMSTCLPYNLATRRLSALDRHLTYLLKIAIIALEGKVES